MIRNISSQKFLPEAFLWSLMAMSALALTYQLRWFFPFLWDYTNGFLTTVRLVEFIVQLASNSVYLLVCYLLISLLRRFKTIGYFDNSSLTVCKQIAWSCIGLGVLGSVMAIARNLSEVHWNDWTNFIAVANLGFRTVTQILFFKEPQTMYFLVGVLLFIIHDFTGKALAVRSENESFI